MRATASRHPNGRTPRERVADGELLGLVGVRDVSRVPPDERPSRRVGDIMVPRSEVATIDADRELADVNRVLELYDVADGKAKPQVGDPTVVFCIDEF